MYDDNPSDPNAAPDDLDARVQAQLAAEAAEAQRMLQGRAAAELAKSLTTRAIDNAPAMAQSYKYDVRPSAGLNPMKWFGLHPDTAAITDTPKPPTATAPPGAPGFVSPEQLLQERTRFKGWAPKQ